MKFEYRYEKEAYLPIVEVILKFKNERIRTDALIDSGAAMCLFKGEIGRALGINIDGGEKKIFQGVSAKLIGYIHEVEITIADKTFKTKIAFENDACCVALAEKNFGVKRKNFFSCQFFQILSEKLYLSSVIVQEPQ